jgi:hypothetical protein
MDLSDDAVAPEAQMLSKLEYVLVLLGQAEGLTAECLDLVPDACGVEHVALRIRAALEEARSELRAGRRVFPADPEEPDVRYWPTEAAYAVAGR